MNKDFELALNSFVKVDQEYICPIVDESRLQEIYYHKILRSRNNHFPDGDWFVTACLKDNEFIFGLYPFFVDVPNDDSNGDFLTLRESNLEFLQNCTMITASVYIPFIIVFKKMNNTLTKILKPNQTIPDKLFEDFLRNDIDADIIDRMRNAAKQNDIKI